MHMAIPWAIFIAYAMILLFQDLRTGVPEWIGLSGLIVVLLALGAWSAADWSMGFIVALGTIFRGMFLIRPPELSDDIYRYLFDGQMLLSGNNPYTTAPLNTIATHPAFSNLAALVNHGDLPTIYPPAAQFVFAAGAAVGGVFGMKLVLVVLDTLMCVLIGQLLKRLGRPRSCLILYAWHPLPILEIAGSGHVDGAGILFLMAALVILSIDFSKNQKPHQTPHRLLHETLHHLSGWGIGCFLAAAMLTKWLPVIFFPGVLMLAAAAQFHRPARLKQDCRGIFAQHSGHDRRFLARRAKRIAHPFCVCGQLGIFRVCLSYPAQLAGIRTCRAAHCSGEFSINCRGYLFPVLPDHGYRSKRNVRHQKESTDVTVSFILCGIPRLFTVNPYPAPLVCTLSGRVSALFRRSCRAGAVLVRPAGIPCGHRICHYRSMGGKRSNADIDCCRTRCYGHCSCLAESATVPHNNFP